MRWLRSVDPDERRCPARSAVHERDCELLAGHEGPHSIGNVRGCWQQPYEWITGQEVTE